MAKPPNKLADLLRERIKLQPGELLYGVVDAAQDVELAFEAKCLYNQEIRTLFEGDVAPALADVAPYVVPIDPESEYLRNWTTRSGSHAGILLGAPLDLDSIHAHLRKIFIVQDEEGQEFFFRYYDPRVLRSYLPSCTPEELAEFFGPIRFLVADAEAPQTYIRYSLEAGRLIDEAWQEDELAKADGSAEGT